MLFEILGFAALVFIAGWVFGGVLLRVVGLALVVLGVAGLVVTGDGAAALVLAIGAAMWLAGHWHYAMRHHEYASPLAQRLFEQALPHRFDPTHGWSIPTRVDRTDVGRSHARRSR